MKMKKILCLLLAALLLPGCQANSEEQAEEEPVSAQVSVVETGEPEPEPEPEEEPEPVYEEVRILEVDWDSLQSVCPDLIGWIHIPQCQISMPIVQGDDNSWYLTHTYTGAEYYAGAIFMNYKNDPEFGSDNSIIYGHSVDIAGGMFTDLAFYKDVSFFENNPEFWILTPEQDYICHIRTFATTTEYSPIYYKDFEGERESVLEQMTEDALYSRDLDVQDWHFVTLSCCNLDYGLHSDQRLALTAALEPVDEIETDQETDEGYLYSTLIQREVQPESQESS